jgi:hypothetical protein
LQSGSTADGALCSAVIDNGPSRLFPGAVASAS